MKETTKTKTPLSLYGEKQKTINYNLSKPSIYMQFAKAHSLIADVYDSLEDTDIKKPLVNMTMDYLHVMEQSLGTINDTYDYDDWVNNVKQILHEMNKTLDAVEVRRQDLKETQ